MPDQPWNYATREAEFRPSPVRAVFELAMDPAYVTLAGGNPDVSLLPTAALGEVAAKLLRDRGPEILQYGSGAGVSSLHETIASLMGRLGSTITPDQLLITTGSQMGIDLVTKLFCNPHDPIVVEGPTYVGAMGVFGAYEVDVHQCEVDDEGVDPEAVAATLDELHRQGRPARFVYCIPHHQNPTGTTLSLARRKRLVEVCAARNTVIVEDDPYAFVGFPGVDPLPSLHSLNPDGVIYLGSMSKLFSPGLRVGWMVAPAPVKARLQIAGESVSIHPSVLAQELAHAWVGTDRWASDLAAIRTVYAQRCRWLLDALDGAGLPSDVTWTKPSGGFFVWLTLPSVDPGADLLSAAIAHKLVLVPGNACYVQQPWQAHVRLAYSNGKQDQIEEGVRRLAAMVGTL